MNQKQKAAAEFFDKNIAEVERLLSALNEAKTAVVRELSGDAYLYTCRPFAKAKRAAIDVKHQLTSITQGTYYDNFNNIK